jgi:hypothetical protein
MRTPRLYWLTIALCALIGAIIGWAGEKSGLDQRLAGVTGELKAEIEKASKRQAASAIGACDILFESRSIARGEVGQRILDACKPYFDYRDYSAPKAAVYALFGAMIGLFLGMFVNRQLRVAGKATWWTD